MQLRKFAYWIGGIVLFFAIWWNQPYFGWNYCVLKGAMRDTDFVEELRPLALSSVLASRTNDVNRAFDLMKQCVAERGLEYCRYAGPDEEGTVEAGWIRSELLPDKIREEEYDKYRYVVKGARQDMYLVPHPDGYYLGLGNYGEPNSEVPVDAALLPLEKDSALDLIERLHLLALKKTPPPRIDEVNQTFEVMKQCVAKQGPKSCRYAGPDETGKIRAAQNLDRLPEKDPGGFGVGKKDAGTTVYYFFRDDGFFLKLKEDKINIKKRSTKGRIKILNLWICNPGCSCNSSWSG